ncbi:M55 family metallopeptidase [Kribbella solani]|uniref:M55 family metallopeptidase n=1 Tax=Kribbella solani TaxID=236067 RepID=UPI0029AEA7DC|nr:M55 family metallopeptidase [Kribbella solani]MDX2968109.1 M55 family metallopeptidase [Kribbella solani]
MRVYISIDLEGVAGIADRRQVNRGTDDYEHSRTLMAGEANAVIAGAFDAGAEVVVVNDSHGDLCNLRPADLDDRAQLQIGSVKRPNGMTYGIDTGFDAAMFIGYHAMAGTAGAVLEHSFSSATVADLRVNGASWGETEFNAAIAGGAGVPVVLVSGDDAACRQAAATLPGVRTVAVKQGLGYRSMRSLSPAEARKVLTENAAAALRSPLPAAFAPEPPYELEIDFLTTSMTEYAAVVPGARRPRPRTVAATATSTEELNRYLASFLDLAVHGLGI